MFYNGSRETKKKMGNFFASFIFSIFGNMPKMQA